MSSPSDPPPKKEHRPDPTVGWRAGEAVVSADGGRGVRRFVVLVALLAVAGAIAGALYLISPAEPPVLFTFPVMEYKDRAWPPNPWAEEDSDALQAAYPAWARQEKEYNYQELSGLQSQLQKTLQSVKSNQPVILHLTALGAVDGGVVYVVPGDAKPGNPTTWVPLDLILKAFAACPAKHKLLLLDLSHPTANLFNGPLADTVGDQLDQLLLARENEGLLPFFVLTSCSKDEFSLPMEEEQQSAFAFYVGDGLRGAAEGFGPNGRHDDRIQVGELAAFVIARVKRWARDCRGVRQTPKLYGVVKDFDLTDHRLPPPEPKEGRAYPDWLFDTWKRRDDWLATGVFRPARHRAVAPAAGAAVAAEVAVTPNDWLAKGVYRSAPVAVNALHIALIPAEQDWQSVSRPDRVKRVKDDLESEVDKAGTMFARARMDQPLPMRSVNALPLPPKPPDDLQKLIDSYLEAAANPKDAAKAKEAQKAIVDKVKTSPELPRQAAELIWRRLVNDVAPKPQTVVSLSQLLDDVQSKTTEAQAARRLATWQRPGGMEWPEIAVRQVLRAEDAATTALAAAPEGFLAAADSFTAAAELQKKGETLVFDATFQNRRDQARDAFAILKLAEDAFVVAAGQMATVRAARRAVDDAAFILSATASRVADEGKETDLRAWRDAATAATLLNDRLEHLPAGRDIPIDEWDSTAAKLAVALKTLLAPYQPAAVKQRVDDLATGRAPEYQAIHAMLLGPLLPAAERKYAWEKARAVAERIHKQTREADAADNDALRPTGTNRSPDPPLKGEAERRERRAELSIALLRVAGLDAVEPLDVGLRAAIADSKKWEQLTAELRTGWTERLPKEAKSRRDMKEWPAADRRERFLPPEQAPVGRFPAAVEVRRQDQGAYLKWLEKHYDRLGGMRHADPVARAFYEDAAKDAADDRRARGE